MTHEVEKMVYVGQVPWHGLGTAIDSTLSPEEVLQVAGLNWTVEKIPTYISLGDKEIKTGYNALVRSSDSSILTQVGNGWEPVQNHQAFSFFNEFVADNSMYIETAGSLKKGKYVWAMAKINESFSLFDGKDRIDSYLLFTNPHEYGKSLDIRFTAVRVVCNNTLTAALGSASKNIFRANHRNPFDAEKAKEVMGLSHQKLNAYQERAEFLASKKAKEEDIVEYFKRIFPTLSKEETHLSKPAKDAISILKSQPGAEYGEGTWWQVFNGLTYYTDHMAGRSQDNRVFSAWLGSNSDKKIEGLKLALEYAA